MTLTSDRIAELRACERRAAVATLVAATGGAIRRLGETMWVDEEGAIVGSVTIGGCVDARVVELAEEVLRTGTSRRVSLPLGDEDAWAFGMTCAGAVDVLVEPVTPMNASDPVAAAAAAVTGASHAGRSAVELMALGGHPARLVIVEDGTRLGSLGDPALDEAAATRAASVLEVRTSAVISIAAGERTTEVFAHVHAPAPSVVIVGATDVAVALVPLAATLGFHTVVIDSRERWATAERFPVANALRVGIPSETLAEFAMTPATALVLVGHDFKYDLPVLEVALKSRVGYIGVLGSRRRATVLRECLVDMGLTAEDIARVRIPVGLDIGARTPQEIALSVLAEIVATRSDRGRARTNGDG
ncbi:MAG TPA: XdhC family protein [Gemmatimonadaceae bacterium]|jgi:xanthine dehydrogenase accessory factor|nr:XdhC family protein [Gemmatimonadaceae bacterium]